MSRVNKKLPADIVVIQPVMAARRTTRTSLFSATYRQVADLESEMSENSNAEARGSNARMPVPVEPAKSRCSILGEVFQLVSDSVLVWNDDGIIVECTPGFEVLMGCATGTLPGQRVASLMRVVEGIAILQTVGGEHIECTIEKRRLDHTIGPLTIGLLRRNFGSATRLETVRGISRQIVERVADVIFQVDNEGRWAFVNQAWFELTGWPMSSTLRHSFYETVAKDDIAAVKSTFGELLAGTRPAARISVRIMVADRSYRWVELALRAATVGRRIEGVVGTLIDITEKRIAEEANVEARHRAESALSTKDMFLANMSHEIRTPMNAVIALTGLLLETSLSDEQRDFVETIRASGDTLLTLINEILDFSKVESDNFGLETTEFNLTEVMEGAMDLVATSPKALQIEIMLRVGAAVPTNIVGDPSRLRQILVNLSANALKFTSQGHVIMSVDVVSDYRSKKLRFEVVDTGIGIPSDRADRLFKPFTQVDASTTRQYGGTGLGLAICRRLVSRMEGRIDFTSEVGKGSTFFFEIPLIVADSTPQAASRTLPLTGHTINLVHPYGPSFEHLTAILSRAGARFSNRASEANVVDESAPDLESLLCYSMTPTVLMVTKARRAAWHPVVTKAKLAGTCIVVVSKPVRSSQLVSAVNSLFADTLRMDTPSEGSGAITIPQQSMPLRVLVAEDNVVNQKVAAALLAKFGHKPDIVSNGVEALHALSQKHYDVVFLDVQMPEMDGIEAAKRIVQGYDASSRPILIAMTANVTPADRLECSSAGCDYYVAKPVKVTELETALRNAGDSLKQRQTRTRKPTVLPLTVLRANTRLIELTHEVGADLVGQIIAHFISDAPARNQAIEAAVIAKNSLALSRAAHVLRSAALNMGLAQLAENCAALETRPANADFAETMVAVRTLQSQLHNDVDDLSRYLGSATIRLLAPLVGKS
jgi:PAS domain S-box-containing protein